MEGARSYRCPLTSLPIGVGWGMLDDQLDRALLELIKQWNVAEERIKKAEQVRGNEVVASAIFELRYAGRKLVDAFALALQNDLKGDQASHDKVHAFLADATEDCVKAKHDAIDAMMTFITSWFDRVERSLGIAALQRYFPDYLKTTGMIAEVQDRITRSRGDRNALRDAIYDDIDREHGPYDEVLGLFDRMRRSNDRVAREVLRERVGKIIMWVITIVGVLIGIAGFIAALK